MQRAIEWNSKRQIDAENRLRQAMNLVNMYAIKSHRFERVQYQAPVVAGQSKARLSVELNLNAIVIKGPQHHHSRPIRDQPRERCHMLFHAAAPRVRYKQQARRASFSKCRQRGGYPIRLQFQTEPLSFFAHRTNVASGNASGASVRAGGTDAAANARARASRSSLNALISACNVAFSR